MAIRTDTLEIVAFMKIMESWENANVQYYRMQYAVGEVVTETVIFQNKLTHEMNEPMRGPTTNEKITMGSPFWCVINSLLLMNLETIQLNIIICRDQNKENKYYTKISVRDKENTQILSTIRDDRDQPHDLFLENRHVIPDGSGWYFIMSSVVDAYKKTIKWLSV